MNQHRRGAAACGSRIETSDARSGKELQIDLLGGFTLRAKEKVLEPLPRKARGLLAYLAMHPDRAIPREKLATLLWENSAGARARRSLRQCLMVLKAVLSRAADPLVSTAEAITLSLQRVDIDVHRLERLARSNDPADLEAGFALYRQEFLFGLDIASESFGEWVAYERQRLSSLASDIGCRLALVCRRAGRLDAAIEAAEKVVRLDPLREEAHRLLMELFNAAGRRSAALKQYAHCRDILSRELGVAPEPATARLAGVVADPKSLDPLQWRGQRGRPADAPVALPMPNRTAMAVLPFRNLADHDQDYFAEGLSGELSVALGRVPWLLVIGSGSTTSYRGDATDLLRANSELGVRYALRGSVRMAGDRIRIVSQLLHSPDGAQMWAERFEGRSDDLFDIQDRIVRQTCAKLAPALQSVEIDLSRRKRDRDLTAYDLYLRALPRFRTSREDNRQAVQLLSRAIELDPAYGCAYGLAARCYQFQRLFGWAIAGDPRLQEGVRLARLAAEIGREDSEALWMAGIALAQLAGELDLGRSLIERSLALNPNSASAWIASSFVHGEIGNTDIALAHFENAQHLNPSDSTHHFQWLAAAFAHFVAGRYENASIALDKTLKASPTYVPAIRLNVSVCGLLGQRQEGEQSVRRLREAIPTASVSQLSIFWQAPLGHNPVVMAKLLDGARLAGLPG